MADHSSFVTAGFDALPANVAILDAEGVIVYTNASWDAFGETEGLPETTGGVGTNYLEVCDAANDDADATQAARGIRAVATGDRGEFSLEYPCHSPERKRWFTMQATVYKHGDERFVLIMHVDITERRRLEQRTREQADRMEGFAKLLFHDLRNPLSVALAQAETLELDDDIDLGCGDGDRSPLRSSLERMESIIDDALALVTIEDIEETEVLSLETAVETAWAHVSTGSATVSVADDVEFRANPDLVSHLFENLFRNSVEHGTTGSRSRVDETIERGGDAVAIEVGVLEAVTETSTDAPAEPRAGGASLERSTADGTDERVAIDGFYIEDDGPGIPAEHREKVFKSGFSPDGGSGLGLAIVRDVADAHGWSVTAETSRDGGARFEIRNVSTVDR
ncbi:ATP-binding protein [Natrinema sp. H-ect4]|uniref:PAS domain-containing sensor histidine kinase n=1 Tax=Natrinema sp. H-ect4 TaxID=3242699 RepID=UPI0035A94CE3